jgi:hypothetical protein
VAFAITDIIARQCMIAMMFGQRLFGPEKIDNDKQLFDFIY